MSNVAQLRLPNERPLLDRGTPWKTAEHVAANAWNNRWCFKAGKFWMEIPNEGDETRGPSGGLEWVELEKDEVRQAIYLQMTISDADEGNGIRQPFAPKKRDVDQVFDALKAYMFDSEDMMVDRTTEVTR